MKPSLILTAAGLSATLLSAPVQAADAAAAEALAKKEGCLKCHAVDKKKDYASLKEISKKYAGKPDAEAKILNQITAGVKVKLDDGSEEEHKIVKSKDQAAINNMIQWILSLK